MSLWRTERINQQHRDDMVNWLRVELRQEHEAHMAQLAAEHQQQLLQLQWDLWIYYFRWWRVWEGGQEGGRRLSATNLHKHLWLYFRTQLSEANDKMLAVQECYISVCKEKDMLEQREHSRAEEEEGRIKEAEVRMVPELWWKICGSTGIQDRLPCSLMYTLPSVQERLRLVLIFRKFWKMKVPQLWKS